MQSDGGLTPMDRYVEHSSLSVLFCDICTYIGSLAQEQSCLDLLVVW